MFKGKRLIGIILTILLVFSISGFTAYYKYTQESGTNFYVGAGDKADALEDTNETRQILDDLGNLLGHSKRDDLYPKDGTTGGYLGRLNYGLDANKPAVPVVNDLYLATDTVKVYRCFVAGNWVQVHPGEGGATTFLELTDTPANYTGQANKYTKVNTGETALEFGTIDLSLYYLKTAIDTLSEVETIYSKNITDSDELAAALGAYYLKTAIDTIGEVEAIWVKNIIDSDELAALKFTDLADTPAAYTGGSLKFVRVNVGETALEFAAEADPTVDTDVKIKAILVDEVTKTGTLTVGNLTKTNNATGVIEDSGVATETTLTVGSDAKVPTSKAVNTFCEATKNYMQELEDDTIPYLGGHLRLNEKSIYISTSLTSDHTYSGLLDYQVVGEAVVFGDLLYFDWTTKRWKKTDADLAANMPGLRIAVESATDGQSCNMLVMGYIRDDTWNFTGAMIYASVTAGAMSSTAPTGTGDQIQRVGVAKSADILFFDPSIDVGEI